MAAVVAEVTGAAGAAGARFEAMRLQEQRVQDLVHLASPGGLRVVGVEIAKELHCAYVHKGRGGGRVLRSTSRARRMRLRHEACVWCVLVSVNGGVNGESVCLPLPA